MKKAIFCIITCVFFAMVMLSCRNLSVIPQALNTINSVSLSELNLERSDYIILNTLSAEATIIAHYHNDMVEVEDPNGEFSIKWHWNKKAGLSGEWEAQSINGIVRLGYLSNDYENDLFNVGPYPHWMVRRMAIYKLINAAKVAGADGIIEPIISTNVEGGRNKNNIILKTTVSGKIIKLKPDGK